MKKSAGKLGSRVLLSENFIDNRHRWELLDDFGEYAQILDGSYIIENRDQQNWNYYALTLPIKKSEDFMLESEIEIQEYKDQGHFGLIWGFDSSFTHANRFTISADGKRLLITLFERNHRHVFYRFHIRRKVKKTRKYIFSIQKSAEYYHFYLNGALVNIVHEYHLPLMGKKAGYYIEPGIRIRSSRFELKGLDQ